MLRRDAQAVRHVAVAIQQTQGVQQAMREQIGQYKKHGSQKRGPGYIWSVGENMRPWWFVIGVMVVSCLIGVLDMKRQAKVAALETRVTELENRILIEDENRREIQRLSLEAMKKKRRKVWSSMGNSEAF